MNWYTEYTRKLTDPEFTAWLNTHAEAVVTNVSRVWDGDRLKTVEALYDLWKSAREVGAKPISALELKISALESALAAKQTIEVNFSLFGRKKP